MMADKTTTTMGPPRLTFHGLRVHLTFHQPKTKRGKRYLNISIKQADPKLWRHHHNLTTPYGLDITFVDTSETPGAKKMSRQRRRNREP